MTTETKRLIRVRTDKGAVFKRDGFGKKRQLADSWRKPRGQHNKQREQKKAKGALPKPGFGSPIAVRGMHPSGFFETLVFNLKDLEGIDPKTHAVRISGTVGTRKRGILQAKAIETGLKVLNTRVVKGPAKPEKAPEAAKVPDAKKKEAKPKAKAVPEKAKAKDQKAHEAKKPVKAAAVKAPEKPDKKAAEKPEKKAAKAPSKDAAKPQKISAKPVSETTGDTKKTKIPAESKAKPKKKTGSEVKKND
jgi:large subunit ribosomal protein L32e